MPQPAKNLVHIAKLRLKAQKIGISRIEASNTGGSLEFSDDTKVDPMQIIKLIQQKQSMYKMEGANKLRFTQKTQDSKSRFILIASVLNELT